MIARIASSAKLSSVLLYNEKKVAQNVASLIHSSGFLIDVQRSTFQEKKNWFQRLNELNTRSHVNMLHISLNFDPSENLSNDQLSRISDRYMQGLGLQDQPYLVYKHSDAGHPHIHIVTSIIQRDGRRIRTNNIGRNLSEPTRKAIEQEFNLVPAGSNQRKQDLLLDIERVQKIVYGPSRDTKQAIRDVLLLVTTKYKFTSLGEYNAILRQYNIIADPGGEGSRIRQHGGLVYRVLDDEGRKVGVPVKASDYFFQPTLANLQKKFEQYRQQRAADLATLRHKVDRTAHPSTPLREAVTDLQREGIELVAQREKGHPASTIYVDNRLMIAAHDHDLGRPRLPELPSIPGFNNRIPHLLSTLLKHDETLSQTPRELREEQKIRRRPRR